MELTHTLLMMLNEMSPYILLGFLFAGLLQAFVPAAAMSRHLGGTGLRAIVKGAAAGVPLPLCSCGVLPAGVALRRAGASKAATTSFMIATPQTGVDSIAATWSLLGPAFAVIRPVAALVTALAGGLAVRAVDRGRDDTPAAAASACTAPACGGGRLSFGRRLGVALEYGFVTMVQSIGRWLVIGLVIAALITLLVPADFLASLGSRPLLAMVAMVAIAVPMYVCATGSIPIALSLMLKGLSPGAAFVLLMAGPAANLASIAVISRAIGRRAAAVYTATIIAGAIAFGLLIDYVLPASLFPAAAAAGACRHGLALFPSLCSAVLAGLLVNAFIRQRIKPKQNHNAMNTEYRIKGMSCGHCKATVEKHLGQLPGVRSVVVDLDRGTATVEGEHDRAAAIECIRSAGFDPVD